MNRQTIFLTLTIIVLSTMFYCSSKQANTNNMSKSDKFTVMFYNVENLFDTINNPNTFDDEFSPNTDKHWNTKRYNKKLKDLAHVISLVDKNSLPDIIGLSEVENKQVLKDLASKKELKANYAIVHEESPDSRGIDVALMYKKSSFKYLSHKAIKVHFDFEPETKTRDILYVKGKMNDGEFLHVFVNHWSSRREGRKESEIKRVTTAKLLKNKVDEILQKDSIAKIIIVGDFNDEPRNKSLKEVLSAANSRSSKKSKLYNLMYNKDLLKLGTYNYRGKWQMLDNIIVSRALLHSDKGYVVDGKEGDILSQEWMMFYNGKYDSNTPNRTYGGSNYYGGISDHLPVFVKLHKK